jgi:hypothetical protein
VDGADESMDDDEDCDEVSLVADEIAEFFLAHGFFRAVLIQASRTEFEKSRFIHVEVSNATMNCFLPHAIYLSFLYLSRMIRLRPFYAAFSPWFGMICIEQSFAPNKSLPLPR